MFSTVPEHLRRIDARRAASGQPPGDSADSRTCDGLYDVLNDACLDLIAAGGMPRERYERLTSDYEDAREQFQQIINRHFQAEGHSPEGFARCKKLDGQSEYAAVGTSGDADGSAGEPREAGNASRC